MSVAMYDSICLESETSKSLPPVNQMVDFTCLRNFIIKMTWKAVVDGSFYGCRNPFLYWQQNMHLGAQFSKQKLKYAYRCKQIQMHVIRVISVLEGFLECEIVSTGLEESYFC
jgi:hypothetical protein